MENMAIGISTTLIGMLIVFSVLCLLALILSAFKRVLGERAADPTPEVVRTAEPVTRTEDTKAAIDADCELVAVITAAIAAGLNVQTDKLVVRSFRKVTGWTGAAREESLK